MRSSKLWGLFSILLIIGLVFLGCPTDPEPDPPKKDPVMPNITAQPIPVIVDMGGAANLSVTATVKDGGTLTYQWWSSKVSATDNGAAIATATSSTYAAPTAAVTDTAWYWVVVTNTLNGKTASANSSKAKVTVNDPVAPTPNITAQPAAVDVEVGEAANLSVTATVSAGTLSYQWWSSKLSANDNGAAINGATNRTYAAPTTAVTDTAWYWVVVTNTLNGRTASATSNKAKVTVTPAPPVDVSDVLKLTANNGEDILNPANLKIESATKLDSTVTITLSSTAEVESGLSNYMEASVYDLSTQGDLDKMAQGFTYISLDGILKRDKTYSIKQTNQSLNLYKDEEENFFQQGTDNVYKITTVTTALPADDYYTFLLWKGAPTKTATIQVTENGSDVTTYVVDWSGVTIETPAPEDVSSTYTLPTKAGYTPAGLRVASATKVGSTVTINLEGEIASGFVGPMAQPMFWDTSAGRIDHFNANDTQGYSWFSLAGILNDGRTLSIKEANDALGLYKDITAEGFVNEGGTIVKPAGDPELLDGNYAIFSLMWKGATNKTVTYTVTEGATVTTVVVDYTNVIINAPANVKATYDLSANLAELPAGLGLASATANGDAISIKLNGTVTSGFADNDLMAELFMGMHYKEGDGTIDIATSTAHFFGNRKVSWVALTGLAVQDKTKTLVERNPSLNLYLYANNPAVDATGDPSADEFGFDPRILDFDTPNVRKENAWNPAIATTDTFGFLLDGRNDKPKAMTVIVEFVEGEGTVTKTLTIDWSAVTFQ